MSDYGRPEHDQILIPGAGDTYETHNLLTLLGFNTSKLRSYQGFGLAPLHFITQRGPFQDGETVLDMRYDTRTIQIAIADTLYTRSEYWDTRYDLLDLLRPNRSFNGTVRPLIYRKWLPGGKIQRGSDMVTTNADTTVTSHDARFIHWGLDAGQTITIAGVDYTVAAVPNDYTIILTGAYGGATATDVAWEYRRGWGKRDLYCLLEQGPDFAEGPDAGLWPQGYTEVLRFVAHDPMWYGSAEQTETWEVDVYDGLTFNATGAWTGDIRGIGRWFFASSVVAESVDVVYWGTVGAKPVVEITGPAINPIINNITTGQSISMTYTIAAGETVYIDFLSLTATNNFGDDLTYSIAGDFATFSLSPAPQAPNRINVIHVFFSGATTGVSAATMKWHNRYAGI